MKSRFSICTLTLAALTVAGIGALLADRERRRAEIGAARTPVEV